MAGKSQHLQPDCLSGMVVWLCETSHARMHTHTHTHTHTLLHHLPGVGLLLGGSTDGPRDVSACVDCVKLKLMGETAAVRGNRATNLKLYAGSLGQPLVHIHVCT